jgi:LytS/YehU family sensor histidine kinase
MLRYQLYECNGHAIAIEKEVTYLANYVNLQELRMGEKYQIQFHPEASLKNFDIPPLLLLPLVENAFKHCSHYTDKKMKSALSFSKRMVGCICT